MLWAWERPEDLRFLDCDKAGVAFLAKTIRLGGGGMDVRPRLQPVQVPKGCLTVATVRIEAAEAEGIRRGIADTLSTTPLDLTVLGGQIQAVMRTPSKVTGDMLQILKPFADFMDQVSDLPDEEADQNYLNLLAIREIFLTSANSSMALVSSSSTLDTRAQALEAADLLSLQFETITDALDVAQKEFETLRVDQQYFSQSASFVESAQITAGATRYLLEASFNLAVEKRFTLNRERAPIEITITEYGELGDEDSNFDLFIASNQLKGNDILLLPAGREVVVYV